MLTILLRTAVVLPIQLILCFKVKSLRLRLLPVILTAVAAALAIVFMLCSTDWYGFVYLLCALYAVGMTMMAGLGWAIWGIVRFLKTCQSMGGRR